MKKEKKIAIGSDHRGFEMKKFFLTQKKIAQYTIEWLDLGAFNKLRSDYPLFAHEAVHAIKKGKVECAVLMCGNGIGMAIAANRYPGIFAGVVWNEDVAKTSKEDDNLNVLVIPSDYISYQESLKLLDIWLYCDFKKGRYQIRLDMIDNFFKK